LTGALRNTSEVRENSAMKVRTSWIGVLVVALTASCSSVDQMSVGDSERTSIYVHCGVRYLVETIDGRQWEAIDLETFGVDPIPADWPEFDPEDQEIDVVVELVEESRLEVTPVDSGSTISYSPTQSSPGCD